MSSSCFVLGRNFLRNLADHLFLLLTRLLFSFVQFLSFSLLPRFNLVPLSRRFSALLLLHVDFLSFGREAFPLPPPRRIVVGGILVFFRRFHFSRYLRGASF